MQRGTHTLGIQKAPGSGVRWRTALAKPRTNCQQYRVSSVRAFADAQGDESSNGAEKNAEREPLYEYDSDDYELTAGDDDERTTPQARQRSHEPSSTLTTSSQARLARVTQPVVHVYMSAKKLLAPSVRRTSATIQRVRERAQQIHEELPEDTWGKLLWVWDRPGIQKIRLTFSMVNLSFRLPALVALIVTQGSLLASQVSLPMLAPLLLGTGMMMRSIKTNASFLFPRLGLLVVMLWILWFTNSVMQNTVQYLKKQGALDDRMAGGIITVTEISTLLVASVVLLSMIGVNVSALLLPAGIAVAVAAKDLSHNFLAGFFLFMAQPFKLGDRVAISSNAPTASPAGGYASGGMGAPQGWFEGICEKVDLRYTVVRQGRRKLMVPNSAFLTREFMVLDESYSEASGEGGEEREERAELLTADNRHVWQYLDSPPIHNELVQGNRMNGGRAGAPTNGMRVNSQGPPMPPPNGVGPPPNGMGHQVDSQGAPMMRPMNNHMETPQHPPQAYNQVYYYSGGYDQAGRPGRWMYQEENDRTHENNN
jgi:hypothetical protein